jgi:uncharacterized protein
MNSHASSAESDGQAPADPAPASTWRGRLFGRHPWLPFVLPFLVFAAFTTLEPLPSSPPSAGVAMDGDDASRAHDSAAPGASGIAIPYRYYPLIYGLKIAATAAAVVFVWPVFGSFQGRVRPLALVVGAAGVVIWIGLCELQLEPLLWSQLGWETIAESGGRSRYNPWAELGDWPMLAGAFLLLRFVGLVGVVPLIEEFFLRGFLMRFVMSDRWWEVPFGQVNRTAVLSGTLVPMMMHPGELLAAAVWFSLLTWLMVRTRNIWDCVAAHAVTNLLLGLYAVTWNQWHFL